MRQHPAFEARAALVALQSYERPIHPFAAMPRGEKPWLRLRGRSGRPCARTMQHEIPAPGYTRISGKRPPPAEWGDKLWCQLRSGWVDEFGPWRVDTTRWIWDGTDGDVVAVKRD